MDNRAIVQGLQPVQHLDEIRPTSLFWYFGRFSWFCRSDLLEQVTIVRVLHHNAKGWGAVFHEALLVWDDVRMPVGSHEKEHYELDKSCCQWGATCLIIHARRWVWTVPWSVVAEAKWPKPDKRVVENCHLLDRCKNTNFVESVLSFFLSELTHFYLLKWTKEWGYWEW